MLFRSDLQKLLRERVGNPNLVVDTYYLKEAAEKPIELLFLEEFFRRLGVKPGQSIPTGEENIAHATGHTVAEVRQIAREVSREILRR